MSYVTLNMLTEKETIEVGSIRPTELAHAAHCVLESMAGTRQVVLAVEGLLKFESWNALDGDFKVSFLDDNLLELYVGVNNAIQGLAFAQSRAAVKALREGFGTGDATQTFIEGMSQRNRNSSGTNLRHLMTLLECAAQTIESDGVLSFSNYPSTMNRA